jgi:two-component system sensor histidine kinase CpxA
MKLRFSLYVQTLCWLGLYLATLLFIVLIAFDSQFGIGWEALLRSPLGDRVDAIADSVHGALCTSSSRDWGQILKQFGSVYHVRYSLYDIDGRRLTDDSPELPKEIKDIMSVFSRRHHALMGGRISSFPHELPPPPPPPPYLKSWPAALGPPPPPPPMHAHGRFMLRTRHPDRFWIGTKFAVMGTDMSYPVPAVLIASSSNLWQSSLLLDTQLIGTVIALISLLSVLFWYPFIYRITRRLSQLTVATEHLAQGKFDTRLADKHKDEIGRLSEAVNRMAEQLNNFVSGQKRFLGAISHELFSPIARLNVALELLGESASPQHQALIADIREEVEEMNNLLHELIAFSKSGLKGKAPELTSVNLKGLLKDLLARLDTESQIVLDVPSDLNAYADRFMLERSISNIVRNSIRYAGGYGPITIKGSSDGSQISLVIADSGPGIAEEALKLIGEPFFRPEPSRDRNSGGVGLGLAIVKSCVEACGGTVSVQKRRPMGLEIELRLQTCTS